MSRTVTSQSLVRAAWSAALSRAALALGLFAASLAVGRALAPSPAAASPSRTCVYCHGTTCGRGTVGGTNCVISPNSCSDGGTCDLT